MSNVLPKTNKEPSAGEKRFVKEVILHGDDPLWMQWVTKRKRDKVQDRLLVVARYRVFSIKRTVTGKKTIRRVGHVFDLKEIFSGDVDKVVFKFKDFDIDIQAPGAGVDLLHSLRLVMQKYTFSFAEYALPKFTLLPPERQLQALPEIDPGYCHGILATYDAYCDYYRGAPSQDFIKFINDIAAKGSVDFTLDECPGIERKENAIDFIPIKAALRFNTYFQSFVFRNIQRREIADYLADTLLHNVTLKKVVLSGCDARDEAFVAIGNALKKNQINSIVDIDFSNNLMKEKGAVGLGEGLQFQPHSIYRLNLSNCGINSKGISAILQAFCFGKEVARSITELDLSHNNFGSVGTVQLANWFNQVTVNCQLRYLLLSSSRIEAALAFRTMKNATIRSIEELDVSSNKFDIQCAMALSSVIDSLPAFKVLNVAYCSLPALGVENLLRSITNNQNLSDVTINISGNDIGVPGAIAVSQVLLVASNLGGLIAKSCGFKKEGLTKIFDAIGQSLGYSTLKALDLSNNFASGTSAKMLKLVQTLADLVKRHPTLEYLGIAGNGDKLSIGKEIEPIFKALSANPRLIELDISGNKIGDQMAVMLCDQLKSNYNLRSLSWDNNQISIGGWRALLTLAQTNRNLVNSPTPSVDMERSVKEAKNKDQFKDKVKEVIDAIRDSLKSNTGGQPYVSIVKARQGKTYGENFKQFMGMGVSLDPNASNSYPTDSSPFGSPSVFRDTRRDTNRASFVSQEAYIHPPTQPVPPPPTPPPMSIPVNYNSSSGYAENNSSSSYGAPPAPPPPPMAKVASYDEPPPVPPRDDTYGEYLATDQPNYSYDNYEYDDTQYEDSDAPPPPPPL